MSALCFILQIQVMELLFDRNMTVVIRTQQYAEQLSTGMITTVTTMFAD